MKKVFALLLLCAGTSFAEPITLNRSSFTQTNDATKCITATHLDKVIVGVTSTAGVLRIYNSTWTTTPVISSITLATVGTYDFGNLAVAGICYITNSNSNGVTILYKR